MIDVWDAITTPSKTTCYCNTVLCGRRMHSFNIETKIAKFEDIVAVNTSSAYLHQQIKRQNHKVEDKQVVNVNQAVLDLVLPFVQLIKTLPSVRCNCKTEYLQRKEKYVKYILRNR